MWLILGVALAIYFLHQVVHSVLPHFFLVPPQRWQDQFLKVLNYAKPIYLTTTYKRSSVRRRLILASFVPSYYTNYRNNKLKIAPRDVEAKEEFMRETRRRDVDDPQRRLLYGFFHPYANNGGGGEKVLWEAVKATLNANSKNICVIYTTNLDAEPLEILGKTESKFQITGLDSSRIVFIYLRRFGHLIDSAYWKRFTIIGQLFGTGLLSLEACFEVSPDVWVDTMGLPSSFLVANKVLKIPIIAYVHYPILQEDMFNKLKYQKLGEVLHIRSINDFITYGKFLYWTALYYFYVYLGSLVDITLANGSWTYSHLDKIWSFNKALGNKLEVLYPPCGTEYLTSSASTTAPSIAPSTTPAISLLKKDKLEVRENKLLYLAQFRPEKRHILVLKEYQQFLANEFPNVETSKGNGSIPTLVFAGSCRTSDDTATLEFLKLQVEMLKLEQFVTFEVDIPYSRVVELLTTCKFGLNAMWNEHFGIGVVEYMAKGCIPIVHASAGPYLDIVGAKTNSEQLQQSQPEPGFFFKSYADPDFDPKLQEPEDENGKLAFQVNGKRVLFPTLENLLQDIFVLNSINADALGFEEKLRNMRLQGQELVREKFSNAKFDASWTHHLETLDILEKEYRNERRGKLEKVY